MMDRISCSVALLLLPVFCYILMGLNLTDCRHNSDSGGQIMDITVHNNEHIATPSMDQDYVEIDKNRYTFDKTMRSHKFEKGNSQSGVVNSADKSSRSENGGPVDSLETRQFSSLYTFNCQNIDTIRIIKKIGHGVSKQTYSGDYNSLKVAVKMVTRHVYDAKSCFHEVDKRQRASRLASKHNLKTEKEKCYILPTRKLMKEILISQQLDSPGLIRLLGYCLRNEECQSTDLSQHGLLAVYELGRPFTADSLTFLPWFTRLKHAAQLANLLYYIQFSPLGSLRIPDFKESHFLMVNSTIKMTDFDDITNSEPTCSVEESSNIFPSVSTHISPDRSQTAIITTLTGPGSGGHQCDFGLECVGSRCEGFNAKLNLQNMSRIFLKRLLLPSSFPDDLMSDLQMINVKLDSLDIDAYTLLTMVNKMLLKRGYKTF